MAGPEGNFPPNTILDLPEEEATALVDGGFAENLEPEPKAPKEPEKPEESEKPEDPEEPKESEKPEDPEEPEKPEEPTEKVSTKGKGSSDKN